MREILFRGKRVDNGEWIEGLPIRTYDTEIGKSSVDYANPAPVELMASGRIVLECGYDEIPFFNIDEYPIVNPETVGQYTGLTDKNGTRIFEGDILIYEYDGEYDPDEKYLVAWDNDEAAFRVNYYLKGEYIHYESITPHQYFEIIGNICDNPELLKGEQKNETTT